VQERSPLPQSQRPARPVALAVAVLLAVAMAVAAACGQSGPTCPTGDLPASCPASAPSYASDVTPIIQARCFPCHANGGVEGSRHNFQTYAGVFNERGPILDEIYACIMPPPGAPTLSNAERLTFMTWLVCGAPNN
jgi:hypothetical protein